MKLRRQSRFTKVCPRRLSNPPNAACPSALLRIEFIQEGRRELAELPGCPYYVNDVLSQYCWFNYCSKDDFSPHSTKEIARVLSLTPAQIEKAEKTAMDKLLLLENSEEIREIRECLSDLNQGNEDDSIYAIGSFTAEIVDELERMFHQPDDEELPTESKKSGKKRKKFC